MRAAGFEGLCGYADPGVARRSRPPRPRGDERVRRPHDRHGLQRLRGRADLGVRFIDIQLLDRDTPLAPATKAVIRLAREAERRGVAVHFETHRDTTTETLEKFSALGRAFQRATGQLLPVTRGHSHFAVSKHVQAPDYAARLLAWPEL